jgi:hypothetical protein
MMATLQDIHNAGAELQDQGQLQAELQLAAVDTAAVNDLKAQVTELEKKLAIAEEATTAAEQKSKILIEELMSKHDAKLAEIHVELEQKDQADVTAAPQAEELENIRSEAHTQLETITIRKELTELKSTHEQTINELNAARARNQELEEKINSSKREPNERIGKNSSLLIQFTEIDPATRQRIRDLGIEAGPGTLKVKLETQLCAIWEELTELKSTHEQTINELAAVKAWNQELEEKIGSSNKEPNELIGRNLSLLTQFTDPTARKSSRDIGIEAGPATFKAKPETNSASSVATSKWAPTHEVTNETTGSGPAENEGVGYLTFSAKFVVACDTSGSRPRPLSLTMQPYERNYSLLKRTAQFDRRQSRGDIPTPFSGLTNTDPFSPFSSPTPARRDSRRDSRGVAASRWATTNEDAYVTTGPEGEDPGFLAFSVSFVMTRDTSSPPSDAMRRSSTTWQRSPSLGMQTSPLKNRETQWGRPSPFTNPGPLSPRTESVWGGAISPDNSTNRNGTRGLEDGLAALNVKPGSNSKPKPKAPGLTASRWATTNQNANGTTSPVPAAAEGLESPTYSVQFNITCDTNDSEAMIPLDIAQPRPLSLSLQTSERGPHTFNPNVFKRREAQTDRYHYRAEIPTPLSAVTDPDPSSSLPSIPPAGPESEMPEQTTNTFYPTENNFSPW